MFPDVVDQVREVVRTLDPARLSGLDTVRLMEHFGELKRLASAAETLLAARAVDANQWQGTGDRSAEHWLARKTGVSYTAARAALETAARVQSLDASPARPFRDVPMARKAHDQKCVGRGPRVNAEAEVAAIRVCLSGRSARYAG